MIVVGIDQLWQMDLANMQTMQKFNDGYRYLSVCTDVLSKYAWVVPLKNKTGPSLVQAFKAILTSRCKPEKIQTDQGTEFFNKDFEALMKEEDIELYNTYNETKASIVKRLIRTLKTKTWRYFTAKETMQYIDLLPHLIHSYNPPVYELKDYDGKELQGTFYEKELQKLIKEDDVYKVEKLLKKRDKNVQYFVKWQGYPNKFNSWVLASQIKRI